MRKKQKTNKVMSMKPVKVNLISRYYESKNFYILTTEKKE